MRATANDATRSTTGQEAVIPGVNVLKAAGLLNMADAITTLTGESRAEVLGTASQTAREKVGPGVRITEAAFDAMGETYDKMVLARPLPPLSSFAETAAGGGDAFMDYYAHEIRLRALHRQREREARAVSEKPEGSGATSVVAGQAGPLAAREEARKDTSASAQGFK